MSQSPPTVRNPWRALVVLCLANFVILLDTTIVNTAVPSIMTSLHTGIDAALWVLNAYLLAFASLLIIFGRLGDVFGPRRLFVNGLFVFTVASVLCGLSGTPTELISARVLQGVAAAMLVPQALVLISAIFPAERRGAAFGIFTAVAGIAAISGPTLGGLLITEIGWQSIFYLNLPIGLAGIALAFRFVPDLRIGRPHRLDAVGVLLASGGLFGVVYGLVEGPELGRTEHYSIIAAGVVALIAFALWERRQPEPLLPMALFRRTNFSVAAFITLASNFALYGFLLIYVLETQDALGMSPLRSGVTALALTVTLSALAPVSGRAADRIGGRAMLVVGLALNALGVLTLALLPTTSSTVVTFLLPLFLVGAGMGVAIAPTTTEAMRGIPPQLVGAASGVINTARQVGAVLGAAVIGSVLQGRLTTSLRQAAAGYATQLPAPARAPFLSGVNQAAAANSLQVGAGSITLPKGLTPAAARTVTRLAHETVSKGLITAGRPTLIWVVGVLVLGSLSALLVRREPPAADSAVKPAQPAPAARTKAP
jgi:EmrB/QacA subfamily drug resistance transporter